MMNMTKSYTRANKQYTVITFCLAFICLAFISLTVVNNNSTTDTVDLTYQRVIVQNGDTLWGLAAKINHNNDINNLVDKTIKYNNLRSTFIQPGQEIYVPVRL